MITLIWAEDENGAIGKDGGLPWRLPNDMKFFKETTTGHTVVMGRKTFESMGNRPLPNRNNVILTRQQDYTAPNATVINEIDAIPSANDIYIIGGSEIYQLYLPFADVLWRTKITGDFQGDTFFPTVDWGNWQLVEEREGIVNEKNRHPHVFQKFVKRTV